MRLSSIFKAIALILLPIFLAKFALKETAGFRFGRLIQIESQETHDLSLSDVSPLDQPYRYFAKGGQAYVFLSEDGKYILKLFKHPAHELKRFLCRLPLKIHGKVQHEHRKQWHKKIARIGASQEIAFERLKEEAGLVSIHTHLHSAPLKAALIDPCGVSHNIDLNPFLFILQKRATPSLEYLEHLIERGENQEAKEALTGLLALHAACVVKGVGNRDPRFDRNFGFSEGRPMILDTGSLYLNFYQEKKDLQRFSAPFRRWLFFKSPELAYHLEEILQ